MHTVENVMLAVQSGVHAVKGDMHAAGNGMLAVQSGITRSS